MTDHIKLLANPKIAQIFIEVSKQGRISAKQLTEILPDIPAPSLYRYLQKLHKAGILDIAEVIPIRGTVEKIYAVSKTFQVKMDEMLKNNDGASYMALFMQYMAGIVAEFQAYTARPDLNLLQDGSGFTVNPIYATLGELVEAHHKIHEALAPLTQNKPGGNRKLHNLCLITTPPQRTEES